MELLEKYTNALKKCSSCKKDFPATLESFHRTRGVYLDSWCKICRRVNQRGESKRNSRYRFKYGVTIADYNLMLAEQNGRCFICKTDKMDRYGRFHIDHCHKTKRVRGLLCSQCNKAIGLFRDSTKLLEDAIKYLNNK